MRPTHSLLLNADFKPIKVIPWERAIVLIYDEKAELVQAYEGQQIRSVSTSMPMPAVLSLRKYVSSRGKLRFNRQNVLARDDYECAYCGVRPCAKSGRPDLEQLTLDHVIPRAQSKGGFVVSMEGRRLGVTCWENVVTACILCNTQKGDRTPIQSNMALRFKPRIPTQGDLLRMSLYRVSIQAEWREYLGMEAAA